MPGSLDNQPELRAFVQDGRIVAIPVKRAKRLLLLDCVAQQFEPGRQYREAEVDAILKRLHDDHAALRRYLIDEGLMSREAGIYWRTGGTVDTGPGARPTGTAGLSTGRPAQPFGKKIVRTVASR